MGRKSKDTDKTKRQVVSLFKIVVDTIRDENKKRDLKILFEWLSAKKWIPNNRSRAGRSSHKKMVVIILGFLLFDQKKEETFQVDADTMRKIIERLKADYEYIVKGEDKDVPAIINELKEHLKLFYTGDGRDSTYMIDNIEFTSTYDYEFTFKERPTDPYILACEMLESDSAEVRYKGMVDIRPIISESESDEIRCDAVKKLVKLVRKNARLRNKLKLPIKNYNKPNENYLSKDIKEAIEIISSFRDSCYDFHLSTNYLTLERANRLPLFRYLDEERISNFPVEIKSDLKIVLSNTDLQQLDLRHARLYHTYMNNCNLGYANLMHARLNMSSINNAWLYKTQLAEATIKGTTFRNSWLYKTNLSKCKLEGTSFRNAHLIETNFEGSDLLGTTFIGATLERVNFSAAYLGNLWFLEPDQIKDPIFDPDNPPKNVPENLRKVFKLD